MRNITYYIIVFSFAFGCSKEHAPDYSGTYTGVISGLDTFGSIPPPRGQKAYIDTIVVVLIKNGNDYLLKGFDIIDIPLYIFNSNNFSISSDLNQKDIHSATGSFDGNSLTIKGNCRYSYTQAEYSESFLTRRDYKFVGIKD